MAAPGLCSPSRKVVSKIINFSVILFGILFGMLNSNENRLNLRYRSRLARLNQYAGIVISARSAAAAQPAG
jgi:hypothetical protein